MKHGTATPARCELSHVISFCTHEMSHHVHGNNVKGGGGGRDAVL